MYKICFVILLLSGCASTFSDQKSITPIASCKKIKSKYKPLKPKTLFDTIIFDIASVHTGTPNQQALTFFKKKLIQNNISQRIYIFQRQNIKNNNIFWHVSAIQQFELKHRLLIDKNPNDRILVIFICYLPGLYLNYDGIGVAGIQYGQTSFAIFRHVTSNAWEGVVLLHELGHILQIANSENRTSSPINPLRPHHCNNEKCTMFWRADTHRINFCLECRTEINLLIEGKSLKKRKKFRIYATHN